MLEAWGSAGRQSLGYCRHEATGRCINRQSKAARQAGRLLLAAQCILAAHTLLQSSAASRRTRCPCPCHHPPQELERLSSGVPPVLQQLLQPHLEDLRDKLQPGLLVLTWTSLNIDGFLHRFHKAGSAEARRTGQHRAGPQVPDLTSPACAHLGSWSSSRAPFVQQHAGCLPLQCLARAQELACKVGDIKDHRIAASLAAVAGARLLDLPADQTFTYDEFVTHQVGAACETVSQ